MSYGSAAHMVHWDVEEVTRDMGREWGTYNESVAVFIEGTDEATLETPHLCVAPLTKMMKEKNTVDWARENKSQTVSKK